MLKCRIVSLPDEFEARSVHGVEHNVPGGSELLGVYARVHLRLLHVHGLGDAGGEEGGVAGLLQDGLHVVQEQTTFWRPGQVRLHQYSILGLSLQYGAIAAHQDVSVVLHVHEHLK